jgi:hypothetical protein
MLSYVLRRVLATIPALFAPVSNSFWVRSMVCAASLLCLFLGAALAWAAPKVPSHVVALERCGGALLVISLALLGGSMPLFR